MPHLRTLRSAILGLLLALFTALAAAQSYPSKPVRPFTVSGDQLKYVTPAASGGGRADLVWKRLK